SEKLYRNTSLLDSGHVQQTAALLANATAHTQTFYGSDVKVGYRLTQILLQHEINQQGFNLTATQDVHFTEVNSSHLTLTQKVCKAQQEIKNQTLIRPALWTCREFMKLYITDSEV
ncbi:Cadherin EGF LAG seven-pass G-type receptor 2, partial [Xenotaenia resolanae]